jgi:hypothetical protein
MVVLAACGSGADTAAEPDTAVGEPDDGGAGDAGAGNSSATSESTSGSGVPGSVRTAGEPFELDGVASSPPDVTTSGLDLYRTRDVPPGIPTPLVDFDEIRSGGPPPDGIPPIDRPTFLQVADVDFLADNEPVLALDIDGDVRAYPVQIMTWHEIVNDTVGDVPVAVSYCPLCNSAVAYDRRLGDRVLDFGTSGLLYNSALVMYDRQTETLWSHFTGQGIIGELTGDDLSVFPLATISWKTFRETNPDGIVLSRDTGFSRDYGRNPYPGYDDVDGVPFLFEGEVDGRYTALTRIVGIESGDDAVGIPLVDLRDAQVVSGEIGGEPLVAFWAAGTSSALESRSIADGVDVGATGVFVPEADGTELTFMAAGDGTFRDDQTGSAWNILGRAIDGELAGETLRAYAHVDTFWFAWSTFRSDTEVLTG